MFYPIWVGVGTAAFISAMIVGGSVPVALLGLGCFILAGAALIAERLR